LATQGRRRPDRPHSWADEVRGTPTIAPLGSYIRPGPRPGPSWRASPPPSVMASVAAPVRHGDRRRPGPSWRPSPPGSVVASVAAPVRHGDRRRPGPSWQASPPRSVMASVAAPVRRSDRRHPGLHGAASRRHQRSPWPHSPIRRPPDIPNVPSRPCPFHLPSSRPVDHGVSSDGSGRSGC
jgi:hypothetical protein